MTRPRRAPAGVLACLGLIAAAGACGGHGRQPSVGHASLGGDIVARVGNLDVSASLVAAVAAARHVTPAAAVALLVDDAVAAKSAMVRGLDHRPDVGRAMTAAQARATVDRIKTEARRAPPTEDEVRERSEAHWVDVDAPESMRVVHAVALRPKAPDPQAEAAAKAVASAIAAAVAGAADVAEFEARARAVPHPGVEVVVQPLQPFAADGRVVVPGDASPYDTKFAAGAAGLTEAGATSGVVESSFGWHVIRLIERRPRRFVPFDERRRMFADEIYAMRGREALEALEAAVRSRRPVSLANGLDDMLAEALPAVRAEGADTVSPTTP